MSTTPPTLEIGSILIHTPNRVGVVFGAGGVGKTTTAAAMALRAAEYGRTVVVLTIDPAKRLAQALGISDLGNTPQRVPLAPSLAGTQEYMAMEKLGQLLAEDRWDLIVVDTPPSRNALDFLDAPQRLPPPPTNRPRGPAPGRLRARG